MSERTERCETCRFLGPPTEPTVPGHCRRHAPHPVVLRREDVPDLDPDTLWPWWPAVLEDDWCGEWQPAEAAAPKKLPLWKDAMTAHPAFAELSGRARTCIGRMAGHCVPPGAWGNITTCAVWESVRTGQFIHERNSGPKTTAEVREWMMRHFPAETA